MNERDAVFRDVALRRLSVPDELTEVLSVTRPVDWLMLCALGLLLAAGLGWAALTKLEVTVRGDRVVYDVNKTHHAAVFVAERDAGPIRPGMTVRITAPAAAGQPRRVREGSVVRVRPVSAAESRVDVALTAAGSLPAPQAGEVGQIVVRCERPIDALLPLLATWRGHR